MKPVIGITVNYNYADHVGRTCGLGILGQDFNYVAGDYVAAIEKAGGIPLLIPQTYDFENLKPLLDLCDGVLVSGGHDVDPMRYGQRNLYSGEIAIERDEQDIFVTRYIADNTDKPILGICRGIQIMNVAFGGTLWQDIEKQCNGYHHFGDSYPRNVGWHSNKLQPGSKLAEIFGKEEIMTNSYHHQAVAEPGEGVTITSYSEEGIAEGIEVAGHKFVVAVQWHPEMMYDSDEQLKLFKAFVAACEK